jgi:hypothetical protein
MATRDAQQLQLAGLNATYHAASGGGDKFKPEDNVVVHVKNASVGSINATVVTPHTVVGQAVGDVVVAVPAGGERFIGPFPREHFADSDDGLADITWSGVTTVTFAVLKI